MRSEAGVSKAYVIVTLMICMAFTGCIEDDVEEDSATLKDSVYDVFDWGNTQNWKKWCSYILFTVEDNEIILANNTELDECADAEDEDGNEYKFTVSNYTEGNLDYRAANNSGFIYSVNVKGITGVKKADVNEVSAMIKKIKSFTKTPIVSGFGIKTPEDAKLISKSGCMGIVIGSTLVDFIEKNINDKKLPQKIGKIVKEFNDILNI